MRRPRESRATRELGGNLNDGVTRIVGVLVEIRDHVATISQHAATIAAASASTATTGATETTLQGMVGALAHLGGEFARIDAAVKAGARRASAMSRAPRPAPCRAARPRRRPWQSP
jgi:hypothetical protein